MFNLYFCTDKYYKDSSEDEQYDDQYDTQGNYKGQFGKNRSKEDQIYGNFWNNDSGETRRGKYNLNQIKNSNYRIRSQNEEKF